MKRLLLFLALCLVGCSRAPVPAEQGTITAINFLPAKSPNAWEAYMQQDETNQMYIYVDTKPFNVKVGDHVQVYYAKDGGYCEFHKK